MYLDELPIRHDAMFLPTLHGSPPRFRSFLVRGAFERENAFRSYACSCPPTLRNSIRPNTSGDTSSITSLANTCAQTCGALNTHARNRLRSIERGAFFTHLFSLSDI